MKVMRGLVAVAVAATLVLATMKGVRVLINAIYATPPRQEVIWLVK
jgi:hypothetical protein